MTHSIKELERQYEQANAKLVEARRRHREEYDALCQAASEAANTRAAREGYHLGCKVEHGGRAYIYVGHTVKYSKVKPVLMRVKKDGSLSKVEARVPFSFVLSKCDVIKDAPK